MTELQSWRRNSNPIQKLNVLLIRDEIASKPGAIEQQRPLTLQLNISVEPVIALSFCCLECGYSGVRVDGGGSGSGSGGGAESSESESLRNRKLQLIAVFVVILTGIRMGGKMLVGCQAGEAEMLAHGNSGQMERCRLQMTANIAVALLLLLKVPLARMLEGLLLLITQSQLMILVIGCACRRCRRGQINRHITDNTDCGGSSQIGHQAAAHNAIGTRSLTGHL